MAISLLMKRQIELLQTTKNQNDRFNRKHEKLLREKQKMSSCCSHRGDSSLTNNLEKNSNLGKKNHKIVRDISGNEKSILRR